MAHTGGIVRSALAETSTASVKSLQRSRRGVIRMPCSAALLAIAVCGALPLSAGKATHDTESAQRATPPSTPQRIPQDARALETHLLEMLNSERSRHGLAPLERLAELDEAAEANTVRMIRAANVQHSPPADLQRVRIRWRALGENVGAAASVEDVHRLMMASREHRANILRPVFNAIGIAVAYGDDRRCYVTEVFALQSR